MADSAPRSIFGTIAMMFGISALVGFNVFTATGWYLERQHKLAVAAVPAPVQPPPPLAAPALAPPTMPLVTTPPAPAAPTAPPTDLPPLANDYKIINAHDHLYRIVDFEKYLPAADSLGVAKTLFVASSNFTIMGKKGNKEEGNDVNSKEVLACAQKYPEKVIPFITFTPATPDKVKLLEDYAAQGAKGIKLYTGHNDFHDRSLDDPDMYPVYEWCEKNQFPIMWHVNMNSFKDEFLKVMVKYPKLKVCLPHFGVGFFDSKGKLLDSLGEIMDTYPNVYTDTSFGTRQILVAGLQKVDRNPDLFRKFYDKYQDRILFGTDMVVTGNKEKTTAWIASIIRACREMHEKSEFSFWMAVNGGPYADPTSNNPDGHLRGLALSPQILKKIYETNIEKFLAKS